MRLKLIIGVLALLLLMVGTASAGTFYLTNASANNGESITGISVKVIFNGTAISVEDNSPALVGATNVNINQIDLNVDNSTIKSVVDTSKGSIWKNIEETSQSTSSFGNFKTACLSTDNNIKTRGPIIIYLKNSISKLPVNTDGNSIVVHMSFGSEKIEVGNKKVDSSWLGGGGDIEIPEFPTMALPFVAILGLLFIFGRRKQELKTSF